LDQLQPFLDFTDVLITATSAPHLIVRPEHISPHQKILILDLAFPRDVDEKIGLLPNVTLFNLEDIKLRVNQNKEARVNEVDTALKIIDEEVEKFCLKSDRITSKNNIQL